ncbi:60S ribosomal protein L13 [Colletotrichum fructicola]|nr:60S ribosomal protein L13 [Colletotrichum fructicola]KAF4930058.1 60S ribosomal protein L13 [Colletotrichum fructicola]
MPSRDFDSSHNGTFALVYGIAIEGIRVPVAAADLLTLTLLRRSHTTSRSPTTVRLPHDPATTRRTHIERNPTTDRDTTDFRKDWQRRVRTHFDQAGKKHSRRVARQAKAAKVAPRPVDLLRPVVRCPTVKYNRKVREGRGFTLAELKAAGIPRLYAPTIGIAVDGRRQNLSEESLAANVARLKAYKERLVVFPRRSNKPKQGDSKVDLASTETVRNLSAALPVENTVSGFSEISKSDVPAAVEGGAYRKLRLARAEARNLGKKEKRARDAAEAEAAKK